jgi:hypothetical protein
MARENNFSENRDTDGSDDRQMLVIGAAAAIVFISSVLGLLWLLVSG